LNKLSRPLESYHKLAKSFLRFQDFSKIFPQIKMLECVLNPKVQLAYSGEFVKCAPAKRNNLICYVLTVYGELYYRELKCENWSLITTPPKFLFRTPHTVLKVDKCQQSIVHVCPEGKVLDLGQKVLYQVKNECWIPIIYLDQTEQQCDCSVIPFEDDTFTISVVGKNPKVLPSSQVKPDQVTFFEDTAEVDVSNLPLDECVLLRYESKLNCEKVVVDYFLIKCSPQTDFCQPIACKADETCGGIFPCPDPTGNTLTVGQGQTYTTIQAAITAANPGDLILVGNGTYQENLTVNVNNLTIRAQNPHNATIKYDNGDTDEQIIHITSSQVVLDGFVIEGPFHNDVQNMYGVYVTGGGSAEIVNNLIQHITEPGESGNQRGRGIVVRTGSAYIQNNTVEDYQKSGIIIYEDSCATILDNTTTGRGPIDYIAQNGITVVGNANFTIRGNNSSDHQYTGEGFISVGVLIMDLPNSELVCIEGPGTITGEVGIALINSSGVLIQENNVIDCRVGILIDEDSMSNVIINNTLTNNSIFDIKDLSVGYFSAGTANAYLCNECNSANPDNRNGRICASTSPLEVLPSVGFFVQQVNLKVPSP